ncbi:MAG: hypothetical protein DSM107014_02230 [Gomphosphaeria aponina SAG 52.96 = DSM 107014]|uniref:Uncharacterized protein n=1 Tax=Gomphosphaeria aponina SAG 52.96 = DSM 107014 TaxID=1521640 RepID=A0A941GNJ3_9CHRO|nr:hypothetical protein [Gomphosphaeria aponina SAG 52.96 = DSM 107014]
MKKIFWLLATTILVGEMSTMAAYAQDDTQFELTSVDCRTLLKMPDEEEEYTMVFYHGYITGKNNQTMVDGAALAEITDQVIDYCINNPDSTVMSGFEQYSSAPPQ